MKKTASLRTIFAALALTASPFFCAANLFAQTPAAAGTTAPASAGSKTYNLNVDPPAKVGQKFGYVADANTIQKTQINMTMPGAPAAQTQLQDEEIKAHIEAEAEVLAIFPNNDPQKVVYTVKTIKATLGGKDVAGLPAPGAKITVVGFGQSKSFTIDGKAAAPDVAKVLDKAINTEDGKFSDQDIFGPTKPVAEGDTWPVNSADMTQSLKEGDGIEIEKATGTIKLNSMKTVGDIQVADVSGDFSLDGLKLPVPGLNVTSSTMKGTLTSTIPSTTTGTLTQTMNIMVKFEAKSDPASGLDVNMSADSEESHSIEITFH